MNNELSTFEKVKAIRRLFLIRVSEILLHRNWTNDFKVGRIQEIKDSVLSWEKQYGSFEINPNDLTTSEMDQLDFGKWNEDNPIRLIPLWLLPFLASEFDCQDIFGKKHSKLPEIDNDHRFGYLAYGVIPKDF